MAKPKPKERLTCAIVVERPPEGGAYRDDSFDVVCCSTARISRVDASVDVA